MQQVEKEIKEFADLLPLYEEAKLDKLKEKAVIIRYYSFAMTADTSTVAQLAAAATRTYAGRYMVDHPEELMALIMYNRNGDVLHINATIEGIPAGPIKLEEVIHALVRGLLDRSPVDCKYQCTSCGEHLSPTDRSFTVKAIDRIIFGGAVCAKKPQCTVDRDATFGIIFNSTYDTETSIQHSTKAV